MSTLLSERMKAGLHLVLIPSGFAVALSKPAVQSNMGAMQSNRLVCQLNVVMSAAKIFCKVALSPFVWYKNYGCCLMDYHLSFESVRSDGSSRPAAVCDLHVLFFLR
jgi:hypothetical protein